MLLVGVAMVNVKELTQVQQERERVGLPALNSHANAPVLRHKLITQPSNLFPSYVVCLINIFKNP